MEPLVQFIITTTVALLGGGLGGAVFTNWQASRRSAEATTRILEALSADVRRAQDVCAHNLRTADDPNRDRPRAFIRLPTQTYELLLFSGQVAGLNNYEVLSALMNYLQQAHHLDSMIGLFEALEAQPEVMRRPDAYGHKVWYVEAISEYSANQIPAVLRALAAVLPEFPPQARV